MKVKMKDNLVELYEKALPGEIEAQADGQIIDFLLSVQGKEVELVFTVGDAFEKK